jgi:hypothetical protein
MNGEIAFQGALLQRFFDKFGGITYHNVPICKYIHYQFRYFVTTRWTLPWLKAHYPQLREPVNRFDPAEIYHWSDGPYPYRRHPGGTVLMRGGFGDIASLYLPRERFILVSPNQAEADVIKLNRPDLTAHSIDRFYRENPTAVQNLNRRIERVIQEHSGDPILGSPELRKWFSVKIAEIVRVLDAVQRLIEARDVGAVLSISSIVWLDSALNLVARANQIPSVTLQHGLIVDRDLFCHAPILATRKMVWGDATVKWYQRFGFPATRTKAIGSARFDGIVNGTWGGKPELCRKLGIDPSHRIAVYATGTDMNTIVPIVINGLRSIPNLYLVIVLHPAEGALVERYRELAAGYDRCRVIRSGEIALYDALSGADYFITHCSTAGLEAMLFKLPVITIEPYPSYFSYGDLGASLRVRDSAELNQVVKRLMTEEAFRAGAIERYQRFLSDYCIPDGQSSRRLFDELELLMANGGVA